MKVKALKNYDAGKGLVEKDKVHNVEDEHAEQLIAEGLVEKSSEKKSDKAEK